MRWPRGVAELANAAFLPFAVFTPEKNLKLRNNVDRLRLSRVGPREASARMIPGSESVPSRGKS
jgi:hypothetical protein